MRHHVSLFNRILIISVFTLMTLCASAQQFKKSLTSMHDKAQSSDAKFNIGIVGGGNLTTWLHFHSPAASSWNLKRYTPRIFSSEGGSLGYFGGLAIEYMVNNSLSIGLNAIYAQHNMELGFVDKNFPYVWDDTTQSITYITKSKTFTAHYRTIEAYVPITYYMTLASSKNIRPYVFVAPRVSYLLTLPNDAVSQMKLNTTYSQDESIISSTIESVGFNTNTYKGLNVGATVGVGSQFRINTSNYYFLVKFDVSANMNALSTYTTADLQNEFNYLRYNADAHASLTIQLPVKKRLKGACVSWGEYD